MPLHEDDETAEGNLTDEQYSQLLMDMGARGEAQGEPPCRMAVPASALAHAVARLDAADHG